MLCAETALGQKLVTRSETPKSMASLVCMLLIGTCFCTARRKAGVPGSWDKKKADLSVVNQSRCKATFDHAGLDLETVSIVSE